MSVLDRDRVASQPVEETECSLKYFYSYHSESFDGRGDHNSAKNWRNDVEELLANIRCTNEQKVAYTTYKLTGKAKRWWQDKKAVLVVDLGSDTAITWDVFKDEFSQHFFPESYRRRRHKSF